MNSKKKARYISAMPSIVAVIFFFLYMFMGENVNVAIIGILLLIASVDWKIERLEKGITGGDTDEYHK